MITNFRMELFQALVTMVDASGGGDAVHGGRVRLPRERLPHAHHAAPAAPRAEAARPPRQGQRGLRLLSRPGPRTDPAETTI